MKRLALLLFLFGLACEAMAAPLPKSVRASLKEAGIPVSAVGVVIQQTGSRSPLVSVNAKQAMNPASTMKLLTTYAGLDLLGPAYAWKTEAYLNGELKNGVLHGDLVLKGYGDPRFTVEQFWLWLRELRARGLRDIRGDLVLDRSFFELPPHDPAAFDNDPVRAYNVGPDALLLNFNTVRLRYQPAGNGMKIVTEPALDGISLDNRLAPQPAPGCDNWDDTILVQPEGDTVVLQGGYPGECGEREHSLSVVPHTRYAESVFRTLWQELGGTLQGKAREGTVSAGAQPFSTHYSAPLAEVIRDINKFSNNVMARQLFLTLGTAGGGSPATLERSMLAVRDWLADKKMYFPELVLENGAGLSRMERISARHLAQLLQSAAQSPLGAEFSASLPILGVDGSVKKRLKESPSAGQAHLKTGTLEGVKTLAGYVRSRSGREWIVVFLINHPNAKLGKNAQDALIEWVQQRH